MLKYYCDFLRNKVSLLLDPLTVINLYLLSHGFIHLCYFSRLYFYILSFGIFLTELAFIHIYINLLFRRINYIVFFNDFIFFLNKKTSC